MRNQILAILFLGIAGSTAAQDTFGLWRLVYGEYVDHIYSYEMSTPFELFITVHEPSSLSIGGYEVSITGQCDNLIVLEASGPNGWTNFGDATNHLVGFQTPLIVPEDFNVLCTMFMMELGGLHWPHFLEFHAADPPSIPGHDGPVYSDGVKPDTLVACGTVTGVPEVFVIGIHVSSTESTSWTSVKSLFD